MTKTIIVLLIALTLLWGCKEKPVLEGVQSYSEVTKLFTNPPSEYGSAPLWVWNTKVTKSDIDSMLVSFKEQAFGGVFVHPRPSLITEYLSKDWHELFSYAVKKGKELGLYVWIYDENSYPSGFAGGHVQDQMPESYNQGQMLEMVKTDILSDTITHYLLCLKEENGAFKDITNNLQQEKGNKGNYYIFRKNFNKKADWTAGFPYVDLLVKGVTEKFLDITMKGYEANNENEFGKTIPGIFTDEPTISAQIKKNIRWTPDLFNYFKQTWGYGLEENLPSLFEEIGNWKKIRHNYYQALLQLYIERWSKPYSAYAEKKGLLWTGHYYEHNWPNPIHGPDHMAMYAWHQLPAIDMLFNEFNEKGYGSLRETQFGNIRSVKELSSVANQLNKKRTLCEAYAGGGWELTLKDTKRLGDWIYVLGVNFLNQHLSHMSINGARKYDYPQSFSYHNPWFPYYKEQNQYFARLSLALSHGSQINDILVIEPTSSAWMYTFNGGTNARLDEITKAFPEFVVTLEKAQVEYDLGSENIIKDHGSIQDSKFVVGHRSYSTVVIPPGMENVNSQTFMLLEKFAKKGGKIIQFEKLQKIDGDDHDKTLAFNNREGNLHFVNELSEKVISEYLTSTDFTISPIDGGKIGGNLFHNRRIFSDGQIVFLSNASMDDYSKGQVTISGKDALLMDLFSGETFDYPEKQQGDRVSIDFNIPPAGSMLFYVADKKQDGLKKYAFETTENTIINTNPSSIVRPKNNTLVIDFCDLKLGAGILKDMYVYNAADTVYKYHGFKNGNPWNFKVQFKQQILDRNNFSAGSGFTATYNFSISNDVKFNDFTAVVEKADLYQVNINGQLVTPEKGQWWIDKTFAVFKIGQYLKYGENSLSYTANPMNVLAEIQPVYILGNFNLKSATEGWTITEPSVLGLGSWKEQGLPMYGHAISYIKEFELDHISPRMEIKLGKWKGTVVSVKVNGVEAGTIAYEPYVLNITKHLRKGSNQVELTVVGSLKNVLGPFHNSPPKGYISPGLYYKSNGHPEGKNYDLYDYGLYEDFQIIELKEGM